LPFPEHLQGTSLKPLLDDPKLPWKTAAFSQYPRAVEGRQIMGYAMRTDRHRYVEWRDRASSEVIAQELYDHRTDPAENRNVAGLAENKELLATLAAQLTVGWQAARPH
jgi:iduronate 2-sulfatase